MKSHALDQAVEPLHHRTGFAERRHQQEADIIQRSECCMHQYCILPSLPSQKLDQYDDPEKDGRKYFARPDAQCPEPQHQNQGQGPAFPREEISGHTEYGLDRANKHFFHCEEVVVEVS